MRPRVAMVGAGYFAQFQLEGWRDAGARAWEHLHRHNAPGAFGGACTALQAHGLAHLQHGTPLENSAQDYLASLHLQQAIYHSHQTGRPVAMAQFDPDNQRA